MAKKTRVLDFSKIEGLKTHVPAPEPAEESADEPKGEQDEIEKEVVRQASKRLGTPQLQSHRARNGASN
jgi:hypothetical protein